MEMTNDIAVRSRNISLVDALDKLLDKGVVVDGDVYLCVAGIELVYLKLKLLLASAATVEKFSTHRHNKFNEVHSDDEESDPRKDPPAVPFDGEPVSIPEKTEQGGCISHHRRDPPPPGNLSARVLENGEIPPMLGRPGSGKVDIDPEKVEQGLAKLVLTVVELLRNLMEKQALRKLKLGTLNSTEVEKLGEAFMRLNEKMKELKKLFGLKDGDLNLDLGPLGDLT